MTEQIKASLASTDEANITATVFNYFNGYAHAAYAQLDGAFSDKAAMFGVINDDSNQEAVGVWPGNGSIKSNATKKAIKVVYNATCE